MAIARAVNNPIRINFADFMAYAVIENTYVPDTEELVFEPMDYEVMLSKPTGGFMDQFGEEASKLMNVEDGDEGPND